MALNKKIEEGDESVGAHVHNPSTQEGGEGGGEPGASLCSTLSSY